MTIRIEHWSLLDLFVKLICFIDANIYYYRLTKSLHVTKIDSPLLILEVSFLNRHFSFFFFLRWRQTVHRTDRLKIEINLIIIIILEFVFIILAWNILFALSSFSCFCSHYYYLFSWLIYSSKCQNVEQINNFIWHELMSCTIRTCHSILWSLALLF